MPDTLRGIFNDPSKDAASASNDHLLKLVHNINFLLQNFIDIAFGRLFACWTLAVFDFDFQADRIVFAARSSSSRNGLDACSSLILLLAAVLVGQA